MLIGHHRDWPKRRLTSIRSPFDGVQGADPDHGPCDEVARLAPHRAKQSTPRKLGFTAEAHLPTNRPSDTGRRPPTEV